MFTRVKDFPTKPVTQSYRGLLRHGNARKLTEEIRFMEWRLQ